MKTIVLSLLGVLLVSGAVVFAVWKVSSSSTASPSRVAELEEEVRLLRSRHESLLTELERANERLAELAAAAAVDDGATVSSDAAVEGASARGPESEAEVVAEAEAARAVVAAEEALRDAEEAREAQLEDALDVLLDPAKSQGEKFATWSQLAGQGLLDDAIAFFEARASDNPHDPDAQAQLGDAYLQKIFTVNELEKGTWAMKVDAAYDRALAIDETHWDARFAKAVSLSFWPPVTGMQPKAIEQFEILRAQQEARPPEARYAETYVYLGNLYANQGNTAKAAETWRRGFELYPENEDLRKRASEAPDPGE